MEICADPVSTRNLAVYHPISPEEPGTAAAIPCLLVHVGTEVKEQTMNQQIDGKHTAEIGDVLKGRVRVAIPLSVVLSLILLLPLMALIAYAWSSSRPTTSSIPTHAEGVGLVPAVHHPSLRRLARRPILAETPATTTTSPCHDRPVIGETRSSAGPAEQ